MIVITGGAGFIGSALLWRLNTLGMSELVVVDHLGNSEKWRNLVKRSYADYMDRDKFIDLVRRNALPWPVAGIVHLGACSSTTETDAGFLMENNFHYSRDLCSWALENDVRFINASSAATYGAGENGFSDDPRLLPKLRPLNIYGYSKHLFDLWLARENLLDSVASLKFFNVYGPNEYHKGAMKSVAAKLHKEIGETGRATLFASSAPEIADGEQKRDFVYVKDAVELIAWLLLDRPDVNGIRNVGSGRARSFNDVARAMFATLGREENIRYVPIPENIAVNYQNFTRADMGWLAEANYPQKFRTLEEGIEDYSREHLSGADPWL
ncbi:MAG: ADP-glyceromanno-heptose 6-epimerase [Desulfovibrio sp.]|nr:ADP-glyceromanno-heptose 6-epimerase [Desulfovibrio sp.]